MLTNFEASSFCVNEIYNIVLTVIRWVAMVPSLIHRYLVREILGPSLLCLLVFTIVMLMGRLVKLVDLVINKGIALEDIAVLFAAMIPSFLTVTLPLAFLMGVMIGLGRLTADGETVALKATGLSLTQLALPVFSLALVFSLMTGTVGIWGKAWGYRTFKAKIFELTQHQATIGFQPRIFMDHFPGLVLYANEINDGTGEMKGLFVKEAQPDSTVLIFAEHGDVYSDPVRARVVIRLRDGVVHRQKKGVSSEYQLVHFSSYDVQPDLGANMESSGDSNQGKTRRIKPKELALHELLSAIRDNPQDKRIGALRSELHQRLTSPMAPVLFALFGLPFSIQPQRSGRSAGFVIGLVIYLTYYILWSIADTLTADVGLSPWLTFWPMHAVLAMIGIYVLRKRAMEQDNLLVCWVERSLSRRKRQSES